MRKRLTLISLFLVTFLIIFLAGTVLAWQAVPDQVQIGLTDLSAQTGTTVTLDDLTSYAYEMHQFNDTSLGCPAPDQIYPQVITPGYQFILEYEGISYDYRVSEDQSIVVLCSADAAPIDGQAAPRIIEMENQPILAISPLAGTSGTIVDMVGNGFPRSTLVLIGIGTVGSEYEVLQTQQTTTHGTLSASITIPDYFTTTQEVVVVVETNDNSLRVISPVYEVNSPADGNVGNPSVVLEPSTGEPGTEVQLTATGYPPNTNLLIGVGPQNAEDFVYSLRETSDAQGTLVTTIDIPAEAQVNRPYIALVQVEADRDYEALSNPFSPTGTAPTPVSAGSEFTSADMYLIATGDNGQSGILIGCDDSAVPVQIFFDPTIAPLTEALQRLLAFGTRTYGQSGLYNALYRSELSVQGIDIDEGVATINLAGTLQTGGVCDTPRIEAQIEQTAIQFATVQSVNVFVNGQPLTDATSTLSP